jgi:hypothetical protein
MFLVFQKTGFFLGVLFISWFCYCQTWLFFLSFWNIFLWSVPSFYSWSILSFASSYYQIFSLYW